MPVSGNEEMGVKPTVGQFSEYSAGIPIKKRRFPFILSPSQSSEYTASLPTENEPEQKGFSRPLQGSTISNDSVVATSSNTSGVEGSLYTGGAAGSLNVSGVAVSLNAGSVGASSNASCVAVISTASSVTTGYNASSAVETSNASSAAASFPNVTSIAANVSSFSDACEKSICEKGKRSSDDANGSMVQGNSNLLMVKLEEQSFADHSRSLADIDNKGKLVATGESYNIPRKIANSELDLVGNDSLTLNIGKDIHSQQNIDAMCRSQLSTVSGNPGLALGLRECLSAMTSGNNEHGFQNQEKAEPVSLNLSLIKGECSTQLSIADVLPNINGANILTDRTNWDLNTTMDSWEGTASDDGASKKTTHTDDIKPLIYSAGMTATSIPTERKVLQEMECRANIEMSSMLSSQQYSTEDSLCLGLTMPYLQLNSNEKPSGSSVKVDSCEVVANISSPGESVTVSKLNMVNLKPVKSDSLVKVDSREVVANISSPGESVTVSKLNMVNLKPVKSEPLDESIKTSSAGVKAKPMGLLNITKVKCEVVEKCSSESSKSSTLSTLNLVNVRSIKPEPVLEGDQETPKRMEGLLNQSVDPMLCPLDTTTVLTSTNLSLNGDASSHVEHFVKAKEIEPSGEGQVASKMISSAEHDVNELNISGKIDNSTSQNKNVEDPDHCRLKFMDVQLPDSRGTIEGSVSDEEKINLSGDILEDDSCGTDYESGGKRELAAAMDMEHDGRTDGEVGEPVENTEIEVPICERREAGNGNNGDAGYRNSDIVGFVGDRNTSSSFVKEKETQREDPGKTSNDNTNECIDTSVNKDSTTEADKEVRLQESSVVEMPSGQTDKKRLVNVMPRKSLDVSEKKDIVKGQEGELSSVQDHDTSQGTSVTVAQGADAGKDVNNGGNRSRIINLSQASNLSFRGRTRSISGRTMQSQVGRGRLLDVAFEGDKFHSRGRDEAYGDGSHRFSRERHHDQPSGNNRISFMRGRGRISSQIDTLRGDRDSECNFASEFYNGPIESCVVRHKYASAVSDVDPNFSSYNNGQDGAYFGTGRGNRKILSDHSSISPHFPSGRRSPGGRDGPAVRRLPMVGRVQRNLSPSRCIGEDGSEVVGLRHTSVLADNHTDPMFARSQPSFEGFDGPFVRGNREFSSVQRRGLPQICSKSPTRPRTRSPGPWSSLRGRPPNGLGGPLELPHRRSPPIYKTERIISPDHPCFAGDMVLRWHGSPPYLSRPSNDVRDLDPGRHPRSGIPTRSPSGRIVLRNSRRLELVDPRERNEGDNYFGRPLPSGRFHELGTDGNADERRYGDRRGPVRPLRPTYSGADSENFDLNAEGGPRSFRYCPQDDLELHERGNMREREFDGHIKNPPGNPPRRTRNIDEQEGNFRHGSQVWHGDEFDDTSRVKRKRF
ncbi:uncharacterized protein LOC111295934 isoform X3 [Durio zibethinus]|uniref:Uncharacterized protein LOC111295934 isoform X3 n=1 Tax=Durio zibethinus TaxID=66656 RepID=A0A6P5YZ23_DURZI|nr:uncharacterized protein LOC111295934 isoform X3 [Durio zibethinus]